MEHPLLLYFCSVLVFIKRTHYLLQHIILKRTTLGFWLNRFSIFDAVEVVKSYLQSNTSIDNVKQEWNTAKPLT